MALLDFIPDEKLEEYAREVVEKTQQKASQAEENLYQNVVDPFSAIFDSARQGISVEGWIEQEKARQAQKTLQNAIGKFHQRVLGEIPGWHDASTGGSYDVGNDSKKIIAEIKNKHNTMNSSSAASVYQKLSNHLQYSHKGYVAYLVEMVPKSRQPYNKAWSPNVKLMPLRDDIKKIDGNSFYQLATGDRDALRHLYAALPKVFEGILGSQSDNVASSDLFWSLFKRVYPE